MLILYGCISIISGVFECGIIWWISEHEKRVERMEDILVELVRDKLKEKSGTLKEKGAGEK